MNKKLTIIGGCIIVLLSVVITILLLTISSKKEETKMPVEDIVITKEVPVEKPLEPIKPDGEIVTMDDVLAHMIDPEPVIESTDVDPKYIKDVTYFDYICTTAQEFATDLGVSFNISLKEATVDKGVVSLCFRLENTDAWAWAILDTNVSEDDWYCERFINKYGSDYGVVYFTNGVPENSEDFYESLFEVRGHTAGITDYSGGSNATITTRDGESLTFEVVTK